MARIKGGMNARRKHNRVLKMAKGYRGARSKQYRVAKQSVMRALYQLLRRKKAEKETVPSALDPARINAAARMNGLSYSRFMYGLKLADVQMNRKMLAEMAVNDAEGFAKLCRCRKGKARVKPDGGFTDSVQILKLQKTFPHDRRRLFCVSVWRNISVNSP